MNNSECIIKIYGITKDSKTNNFMMVLEYAKDGNLRQRLNKYFDSYGWMEKIKMLRDISFGLNEIHKQGLIHQDFHSGNILDSLRDSTTNITDLGLCMPANSISENYKIYGVLPYVAPEVLREKKYTQASNVYSFGIIIYEVFNVLPPYHDIAHEELLAIKICQGLRPRFNIKVPRLIEDIAKQCVDADPLERPSAEYLKEIFDQWCDLVYYKKDSEICKQINEVDIINEKQPFFVKSEKLTYTIHPQAIYTSRLLDFDNLPEPKNAD
jgi:serine/threonine protein kinase